MSKNSSAQNKFTSSQMIPQDAAASKLKLSKVSSRYIELSEFAGSDLHRGYFCYNCVYFMKPNHCSIVTDEGVDILGQSSDVIAPHGICALWTPNKNEIHTGNDRSASSSQGKSNESTTSVSASFSCELCNERFNSREDLKQHTIEKHTGNR
jgi:Zinc-finger of C2H2 type